MGSDCSPLQLHKHQGTLELVSEIYGSTVLGQPGSRTTLVVRHVAWGHGAELYRRQQTKPWGFQARRSDMILGLFWDPVAHFRAYSLINTIKNARLFTCEIIRYRMAQLSFRCRHQCIPEQSPTLAISAEQPLLGPRHRQVVYASNHDKKSNTTSASTAGMLTRALAR